ncbi:MAG: hypothetical protein KTR32_09775 [Granulosicoccus sp.]|nr:hypothetical protein [Granulosicoccus sp.]
MEKTVAQRTECQEVPVYSMELVSEFLLYPAILPVDEPAVKWPDRRREAATSCWMSAVIGLADEITTAEMSNNHVLQQSINRRKSRLQVKSLTN